ncbi:MAG: hypothetical protein JWN70_1733 [Planctomycetaceae bacterium]|nr:hypothetical protein [Planctomycetaceae bacterium]
MRYHVYRLLPSLIAFPLLAIGCAPAPPKTVKVKGIVSFNGEKLTSGTISFVPTTITPGEAIHPVTVELDNGGNYNLSTFNAGDGVSPGQYSVTVVSYDRPPDPATPGQEVWSIPRKYGNPQASGLRAEIRAEDPQPIELDFDLVGEKNK